MSNPDQISYGRTARLRTALASLAAGISDSAAGMVTTHADGYGRGGEWAEPAAHLAADARELLGIAVAYERSRGTSWEVLADVLGLSSRQAAHEKYAAAVRQLDEAITECWLLGDDPRHIDIPEGATDTAGTACLLDRWVIRHLGDSDPLAHKPADDPARTHPVSAGLKPMDSLQHSSFVTAGATLIMERAKRDGYDDPEVRQLQLGFARRKVEMYERMTADEAAEVNRVSDYGTLRDLLAEARARLAELEAEASPGRG